MSCLRRIQQFPRNFLCWQPQVVSRYILSNLCSPRYLIALDTLGEATQMDMNLIIINQLPVSVTRWQHGSQICFANFYLVKIHKIVNNSTTTKAREKNKHSFGIL